MISVVIPAYNEEEQIGECLEALARQEGAEAFEVIVVDNCSTDCTRDIAQSFEGKLSLRVIRQDRKGRGAARRAGFEAAKGDIILSTDADCVPPPTWVRDLTTALREDPKLGGVTSPLLIEDCSTAQNAILNLQWLLMLVYRFFWGHYWLNGFSFGIRRETYDAAGGFDYHADAQEDSELSRRVRHLGRIRLLREPKVMTSGRRFQEKGLVRGLWPYISSFVTVRLSRGRKRAELSDIR